jgi:tetratricopeptide (TPR) repeat protein
LKERTRERVPLDWATTQNNLGNAFQTLGLRENGIEKLEEAVEAYREALKEMTRERVSLQWAGTQNNLGNALKALGERENNQEYLKDALKAISSAWNVYKDGKMFQYSDDFERRINEIKESIEKMKSDF